MKGVSCIVRQDKRVSWISGHIIVPCPHKIFANSEAIKMKRKIWKVFFIYNIHRTFFLSVINAFIECCRLNTLLNVLSKTFSLHLWFSFRNLKLNHEIFMIELKYSKFLPRLSIFWFLKIVPIEEHESNVAKQRTKTRS